MIAWLTHATEVVRESEWGRSLQYQGVDLWDASRATILRDVFKLVLDGPSSPPGALARRILQSGRSRSTRLIRHIRSTVSGRDVSSGPIFFWPVTGSHLRVQLPVYRELAGTPTGENAIFIVDNPDLFGQLLRAGAACTYLPAIARSELSAVRRDVRSIRAEILRSSLPSELLPPTEHVSQGELVRMLQGALSAGVPAICRALAALQKLDRLVPAGLLVVGNDHVLQGRAAALWARANGWATASIMHGLIGNAVAERDHLVDRMLVFGTADAEVLDRAGFDRARTVVCGPPHMDRLPEPSRASSAIARLAGGTGGHVLIANSGPGYSISLSHHVRVVTAIARLAESFPDRTFVVKLHVKDRPAYYRQGLGRSLPKNLVLVTGKERGLPSSIFEWLRGASLLITGGSSSAVDALAMGVPVVTLDLAGELRDVPFIAAGASTHVTSEADLAAAVGRAASEPAESRIANADAEQFLRRRLGPLDGGASKRCALALAEIVGPS